MTIARYCGGLFLALSLAAMGTATGCTQAVDDSEDIGEEDIGEEALALSGAAAASGAWSDGKRRDCDDDDDRRRGRCRVWEATADIDRDAEYAFIKVNKGCDVRRVEFDGEELKCLRSGPKCDYEGFADVDCVVDLDDHGKRYGRRGDKEEELEVRLADCDQRGRPEVKIVVLEDGRFERVDDDDLDVECRRRERRNKHY